ncbi:cation diffusion facilitator family transporter [Magnetovibrio sp. PR-2]|uniref:cation diffusion facilitator family transporter n=1 Tax=Magnetovibrio sp. PR-2 TaxID=3120356 RepID=UPI002FCE113E
MVSTSHNHSTMQDINETRIGFAALLTGTFMIAEVVGGVLSGSLALLADAGHMVTDFASLCLAWFAFRLTRRPADWQHTYGYDRFMTLAAFVNGLALFVVAAWIIVEAFHRLNEPTTVLGGIMLWVAMGGLFVNLITFWMLHGGDHKNLNLRAAYLHVLGDLLGSVAALIAAVVILLTGWMTIDPLLSLLVALLILRSGWYVVRDSGNILLEGAPNDIDRQELSADLVSSISALTDIHHVHIWSISENRHMATLHARVSGRPDMEQVTVDIKRRLQDKYGINHATVEIEFDCCADDDGCSQN